MLCILQIGLFIAGISILIKGKFEFSGKEVSGVPAYLIGALLLLPLPVAFAMGLIVGFLAETTGSTRELMDSGWFLPVAELAILGVFGFPALIIALLSAKERPRRRRRDRYDYEDRSPQSYDREYGYGNPSSQPYGYPGQTHGNPSDAYPYQQDSTDFRPDSPPPPSGPGPAPYQDEPPTDDNPRRNFSKRNSSSVWWLVILGVIVGFAGVLACGVAAFYFLAPGSGAKTKVANPTVVAAPNPPVENANNNALLANKRPPKVAQEPIQPPPVPNPQPPWNPNTNAHSKYEQPAPPSEIPFQVDPQLLTSKGKIYLSDLQEFAVTKGPSLWKFAKNGKLGHGYRRNAIVEVNGKHYPKGLGMHPPDFHYIRVCYQLGGRAKTFQGQVALNDLNSNYKINLRFAVLGDGKLLWRSPFVHQRKQIESFNIDVSQVQMLELRTYVEETRVTDAHAVWLDPYVTVK